MHFRDRIHAGRLLSQALVQYEGQEHVLILALPRGGVPVGAEVARALRAPLHVLVMRKIGHPLNPEVAVGAVSEFGSVLGDTSHTKIISDEYHEAQRQREQYEPDGLPPLQNKTVILVDDGIATGFTMQLAIQEVKRLSARHVVVATPVAPRSVAEAFHGQADDFIALHSPETFLGVGAYYDDFRQLEDEEVIQLLASARSPLPQSH